jgi:hypothetical protein
MGLPASGKTTFLAALWHLVEANETHCNLRLESYAGDLGYLNSIAESWRTFKPVPRTSQVGDKNVSITLTNSITNVSGSAFFPDLAGETFDRQVEERICEPEFIENLSKNNGILFFINADVKEDGLSITEFNARMPVGDASINVLDMEHDGQENESKEWEPKYLPTQVKIVQLLSDLIRPPFELLSRRIAVMISAWDVTRGTDLDPQKWLAVNMPLVDQFLRSNKDYFEFQVYGVSAQGIRLEDNAAIESASKLMPSRRIQIVGPDHEGHDLTEPLIWLMSVEE